METLFNKNIKKVFDMKKVKEKSSRHSYHFFESIIKMFACDAEEQIH